MSKYFKTRRRMRHGIIFKYIIIILLSYIIIKMCFLLILKIPILSLVFKKDKLISYKDYIIDNTINKPKSLLDYNVNTSSYDSENIKMLNYVSKDKPLIYIYNTHQTESYSDNKTVLDAGNLLKKELIKYNVDTIVEDGNITEFLRANNMNYNYSYYASKFYIKEALEHNDFDLLIDLHRDALSKESSTTTINKKSCAKILFVVGSSHKNYKTNYDLAIKLNDLIKEKYPNLTRGVFLKEKASGSYNQDIDSNIILLEMGGNNNNYNEVSNTISLLAPIIGEYLYERQNV